MIAMYTKGIRREKTVIADSGGDGAQRLRCAEKPEAFTPEMASFSNEFEFDPLRGPVKDFSQTLFDEHDEVVKRVSASLSGRAVSICWTRKIGKIIPARR